MSDGGGMVPGGSYFSKSHIQNPAAWGGRIKKEKVTTHAFISLLLSILESLKTVFKVTHGTTWCEFF
jgi:hypothetical protein